MAGFATLLPKGHLPENVLHFVRVLRGAGLPVGPAKVIDALAAVEAVGVGNRSDFREALAAVLCSRREHLDLYEQAFELFWRNPKLLEKMVAAMLPRVLGRTGEEPEPPPVPGRLAEALMPPTADVPRRGRRRGHAGGRVHAPRARCCRRATSRRCRATSSRR